MIVGTLQRSLFALPLRAMRVLKKSTFAKVSSPIEAKTESNMLNSFEKMMNHHTYLMMRQLGD